MKKYLLLLLGFFLFLQSIGQSTALINAKLSANLQQYLAQGTPFHHKGLVRITINNKTYLSALIKVSESIEENQMLGLGILVGTKAGAIWTVQIPEQEINSFIQLDGIDFIQLDEPIIPTIDISRKVTRVDSVHKGILLPMAYSGKNVVVGIIDAGFDYSHPTFYDTIGTRLRLKRVWEQKNSGTPPVGFAYGNELLDTTAMLSKGTEVASFSHGTHVGGIAAGSGIGSLSNRKYRGMAYESDLVFVGIQPEKDEWKTAGMSSIIDGISYIYNYAASVGKPAVVNLSWGCSIGPNDGTSLFSQACDNLTGPGRIFVLAAGNNGEEKIHLQKTFSSVDTTLQTFLSFDPSLSTKTTWVDIWGEKNKTFCLKLTLYNGSTAGNTTGLLCLNNTTTNSYLVGSNNDTCFFTITRKYADYNGKPHILLDVFSKTADALCLTMESKDGTVHLWDGYVEAYRGYYGEFANLGFPWAAVGNSSYTLGEMACTKSAIAVAAFASKVSFTNLSGTPLSYSGYVGTNQIVPFSSHGPTADLRMKPDIAAPGLTIASSVNSYDVSYATGGSNYNSSVVKYINPVTNKQYYYAESSGTSMASPAVSGIVALLLQANPFLRPEDIQKILKETAIKDNFTTLTPDSSRWGAGKVNAYAATKKALAKYGIKDVKVDNASLKIYPNPNQGAFILELKASDEIAIDFEIINVIGQTVFERNYKIIEGINQLQFNLKELPQGFYYALIRTASGNIQTKMVIRN